MNISNLSENSEDFTGNVWHIDNSETVLIDVGTGDSWKSIKELKNIDKVVITHSHYDHIDNISKIEERFNPVIYAFNPDNLPVEAKEISEGDSILLCNTEFEIFHTPGHKDDSICLYSPKKKIIFTGDLIFPNGGFGRTDLAEGDRDLLISSIEKIKDLDFNTIYPGHEDAVRDDAESQVLSSLKNAKKREPKY